jgi:hypothetical protein
MQMLKILHCREVALQYGHDPGCEEVRQSLLGQCEKVMFNVGGWRKARQEQQMRDWFGFVPTFYMQKKPMQMLKILHCREVALQYGHDPGCEEVRPVRESNV